MQVHQRANVFQLLVPKQNCTLRLMWACMQGTGLGLYYPVSLAAFNTDYTALAGVQPAVAQWFRFLRQLYDSTAVAMANKGDHRSLAMCSSVLQLHGSMQ